MTIKAMDHVHAAEELEQRTKSTAKRVRKACRAMTGWAAELQGPTQFVISLVALGGAVLGLLKLMGIA